MTLHEERDDDVRDELLDATRTSISEKDDEHFYGAWKRGGTVSGGAMAKARAGQRRASRKRKQRAGPGASGITLADEAAKAMDKRSARRNELERGVKGTSWSASQRAEYIKTGSVPTSKEELQSIMDREVAKAPKVDVRDKEGNRYMGRYLGVEDGKHVIASGKTTHRIPTGNIEGLGKKSPKATKQDKPAFSRWAGKQSPWGGGAKKRVGDTTPPSWKTKGEDRDRYRK